MYKSPCVLFIAFGEERERERYTFALITRAPRLIDRGEVCPFEIIIPRVSDFVDITAYVGRIVRGGLISASRFLARVLYDWQARRVPLTYYLSLDPVTRCSPRNNSQGRQVACLIIIARIGHLPCALPTKIDRDCLLFCDFFALLRETCRWYHSKNVDKRTCLQFKCLLWRRKVLKFLHFKVVLCWKIQIRY